MTSVTVLGSGFPWRQDKAALVQGPAGLALGRSGTLYVASTTDSSISAIPDAVTRTSPIRPGTGILTRGGSLNGPLGLTLAPDGNLIAVNGNNGNAVEVTPTGRQVATVTLVPHGAGDLFGSRSWLTARACSSSTMAPMPSTFSAPEATIALLRPATTKQSRCPSCPATADTSPPRPLPAAPGLDGYRADIPGPALDRVAA